MDGNKIKIVTHSSGFHSDDVFAVATLLVMLGENTEVEIIRSRDTNIINSADYVVDVGGIHDPSKNRFDHHQIGGAGERENGVKYASFGLVWKTYGEKLCGSKDVANKVDRLLVQPIDAPDNGISVYQTKIKDVSPVDIGFLTHMFEPTWKEDLSKINDVFVELVSYAKFIVSRAIKYSKDIVEAERLVLEAYNNSNDKRLIEVDSRYPWLEVLSKFPEPLFAMYENKTEKTWAIKGVRSDFSSFVYRKFLPESWAGKRDDELEKITGVEGSTFCHNGRFIVVAKTKEAILKLAEIALAD